MTGLDVEAVLAAERCRDVHGDTYTEPWCHACRSWAAHVAAVLRVEIESALGDVLDESLTPSLSNAHWACDPLPSCPYYAHVNPDWLRALISEALRVREAANPYRPTLAATEGDGR